MIKQRHVAALLAEFIGTLTLVLVVLSVALYRFPFFTAIAAGVTIAVFVSAFAKIGSGHFNPAVTVGLFAIRQVSLLKAVSFVIVQFLAGLAGWQLYEWLTERALTNTTTAAFEWDWTVAVAEFIGAFVFGTAVAAAVTQKMQGYQQAYTIGAGLFLGLTVAGLASASILNPAVALGTRTLDINYVAAPILGVLVACVVVAYVIVPIFGIKKKSAAAPTVVKADEKPAVKSSAAKASVKKAPAKKPAKKATARKKTSTKKK